MMTSWREYFQDTGGGHKGNCKELKNEWQGFNQGKDFSFRKLGEKGREKAVA